MGKVNNLVVVKIKAGLGNQLFQYASARQLAINENKELYFDVSFYNDNKFKGIFRLDKYNIGYEIADQQIVDRIKNKQNTPLFYRMLNKFKIANPYNKPTHWKQKELNKYLQGNLEAPEHIYLDDWFASPCNFGNIRDILLAEIIPETLSEKTKVWQIIIENSNSVSIHIRRGDYLTNPYFHNLSINHYLESLKYINERVESPVYFVFTDDLDFVKNHFSHIQDIYFVDSNNKRQNSYSTYGDMEDLHLMSKCKHNIIANSSFSWWGAWLNNNKNKIVIAPRNWYDKQKAQKKYEKGNLIPEDWIKK